VPLTLPDCNAGTVGADDREIFWANWHAAPATPNYHEADGDDAQHDTASGEATTVSGQDGIAIDEGKLHDDLRDLLELAASGEAVMWPAGWSETLASDAIGDLVEAPTKKPRLAQPEAARASGSTPASARPMEVHNVEVVPRDVGHGARPVPAFGSGHDLRRSGQVAWCRKCGRYGEERLRADGLGGPCKGPRSANAAHLRDLRNGIHPRTGLALPPDVAI